MSVRVDVDVNLQYIDVSVTVVDVDLTRAMPFHAKLGVFLAFCNLIVAI